MLNWVNKAFQGGAVRRWHVIPIIGEETVGHHTFGVAMMTLAITDGKASGDLLRAALFHDCAEGETGDLPADIKRNHPHIKKVFGDIEEKWERQNGFFLQLDETDTLALKHADVLQLLYFCKAQLNLGNINMEPVLERATKYAQELEPVGKSQEILDWLLNGQIARR